MAIPSRHPTTPAPAGQPVGPPAGARPIACLTLALTSALAVGSGAARGDVTKVEWGPGRPPRWTEQTITSPHRVEVSLPAPPAGHEFVTVVVETEQGRRVRNLHGQVPLASVGGGSGSAPGPLSVVWDGLDDAGAVVPAGTYQLRGLTIPRPRIHYDYSFYNPNPLPWQGYAHSGWAADHTGPSDIACAPEGSSRQTEVVISCGVAENPHAVLGLDETHRKLWGYKREAGINGINAIDYADGLLWMGFKNTLLKIDADSRADVGWKRPAGKAAAVTMPGLVTRIAVAPERGAALVRQAAGPDDGVNLAADTLVIFDKESGTARNKRAFPLQLPLPGKAYDLAYLPDGRLVVSGDEAVSVVAADGTITPLSLPGCRAPRQLAADAAGNLAVFDAGPDRQVKVYGPDLQLLRTVGRAGGQRTHSHVTFTEVEASGTDGLAIDYDAFRRVGGMDMDRHGRLWVTEPDHPRMVTVWDGEGKQVARFVGNAEYGGQGCSLHEQDPALAFAYGLIFRISPDRTVPQEPVRFASSFREPEPAALRLPRLPLGHYFKSGRLFRSAVSGTMREYLVHNHFGYPVLCVERDGDYRPCAAAVVVAGGEVPAPFAKADLKPGPHTKWYGVWSDANGDELVQPEEVVPLPEAGGRNEDFYGMGYVFNPQLTWYLGGHAVEPAGFLADGTPTYAAAGVQKLAGAGLAVRSGDFVIGDACGPFQPGEYRFADLQGNVLATYPLPVMGVHASMHSSAPRPGETRGELCYAGTGTVAGDLGPIVATQGNMGQMFVFSGDGLFVCSLFKDTRQGPRPWPPEAMKGVEFTECTMGQEPFVGSMVVQDDGAMRLLFGRTAANVCVVKGLDQAKRFGPVKLRFDPSAPGGGGQIAGGAEPAAPATVAPTESKPADLPPLAIGRLADDAAAIAIDGDLGDWPAVPEREIEAGGEKLAGVRMVHAGARLLVGVTVKDETPLVNGLADWRAAFRTGDAIDLCLGPAGERESNPGPGDVRLLLVPAPDGGIVVRYRPVVPGTAAEARVPFTSPVCTTTIDEVEISKECDVVFKKTAAGYVCEASLPLSALGIEPAAGQGFAGDVGVLSSDGGGQQTVARNYLFNRTWTMTADLCCEAMLKPDTWGVIVFE
jgi:hypothetical protein